MELNAENIRVSHALPEPGGPPALLHRSQPWYLAYMDALFESDRNRIGERIRRAEQLIVFRERELRSLTPRSPEQRALHNALHALRALRSCFGV
jgi:hypothetical protein